MDAGRGTLPHVVVALRVVMGVLFAVVTAVLVLPLLLVFDLISGGTALGLCPAGLRVCQPGYFTGPELLGVLLIVVFVAVMGIGLCARGIRYLEKVEDDSGVAS
jgi:hypothetical protein